MPELLQQNRLVFASSAGREGYDQFSGNQNFSACGDSLRPCFPSYRTRKEPAKGSKLDRERNNTRGGKARLGDPHDWGQSQSCRRSQAKWPKERNKGGRTCKSSPAKRPRERNKGGPCGTWSAWDQEKSEFKRCPRRPSRRGCLHSPTQRKTLKGWVKVLVLFFWYILHMF